MPWKLGVEVNGICGRRREIFLTLWFEVGASNEKSCLWRSVNNACAASFHGLSIIHMCLPFPSSRWVSPCILYRLLLTFVFWGWWAGEYGFSILGVNAPNKRTVVLYRILTFIKCTHTWNNKFRFWAKIVTMICGK